MSKNTEAAPQLPPASVDFNKLHAECRAGRSAETALKNAVIEETVARPTEGIGAPEPITDESTIGPVAEEAPVDTDRKA